MTKPEQDTIGLTYMLNIHMPVEPSGQSHSSLMLHLDRMMRETEENLTDLLPAGWWVELHEWDEPLRGEIAWRDPEDDSGFLTGEGDDNE